MSGQALADRKRLRFHGPKSIFIVKIKELREAYTADLTPMRLNGAPGVVGQLIYVVPAEHCSCQHLRLDRLPNHQPWQCYTYNNRYNLQWGTVGLRSSLHRMTWIDHCFTATSLSLSLPLLLRDVRKTC